VHDVELIVQRITDDRIARVGIELAPEEFGASMLRRVHEWWKHRVENFTKLPAAAWFRFEGAYPALMGKLKRRPRKAD
jgi:hypothetical protein